jgi:hypothetical protein
MIFPFRQKAKEWLFEKLFQKKFFPGRMTPRKELIDLIEKLRPIETDKKLIRLGPAKDGGYLVPDDLEGIEALISPGVDIESGFELDCAGREMEVFMVDASVAGPAIAHPRFHFYPLFMGTSADPKFVTLEKFISEKVEPSFKNDLLLQMDIEGAEWETLLQVPSDVLNRFRIMVIEFHNLDNLHNKPYFDLISGLFEKLLHTHRVVHLHPNNACKNVAFGGIEIPEYMEFTFLRKDRIGSGKPATQIPHPLDVDCTVNAPYPLPSIWYKSE